MLIKLDISVAPARSASSAGHGCQLAWHGFGRQLAWHGFEFGKWM